MITVKLWGGLCNQMFQYAFAYSMAKSKGENVVFDVSYYDNQPKYVDNRKIEVNQEFKLPFFDTTNKNKNVEIFQNRYVSYIIRHLNFFHIKLKDNIFFVKEKEHKYIENVPYIEGKNNYYDGYWQSELYFKKYSDSIRDIFTPDNCVVKRIDSWLENLSEEDTIAVHIRRGDLAGKIQGYSDKEMLRYYKRAIDYMKCQLENPRFIFFSDDIDWCKEYFSLVENAVFQDNKWDAVTDLIAISKCKHGIMSASTFSWWGNWLRNNMESIIIAPKGKYFNDHFLKDDWIMM